MDLDNANALGNPEVQALPVSPDRSSPATASASDSSDVPRFEAYWDSKDGVFRCRACGHELWTPTGQCTGCFAGEEYPYYEVLDPELGPRPGIVWNESDMSNDVSPETRDELVGEYLEFESSAYDSQDGEDGFGDEEYEMNSFIDDGPQGESDDSLSSSDGEIDYKERF